MSCLHGRLLGLLQTGQAPLQVVDPPGLVFQALAQLAQAGPQRLSLGSQVTTFDLQPLERLGRRREPAVMLVQCPVPTGHLVVGVARRPLGHVQGPGGLAPLDLGIGQPALSISQRRAGRSPPVPTDPPARRAETVTGQGDDDGLRVAQGQIDHGVKIAVDDHGVAKQAV